MWRSVDNETLKQLAFDWMQELRAHPRPADTPASSAVVLMNFTAPHPKQWEFLLIAVEAAESENELAAIAAGPFEHLLGWHGEQYIAAVETRAHNDAKFARMIKHAWRYKMTAEVWGRVQTIQERVR